MGSLGNIISVSFLTTKPSFRSKILLQQCAQKLTDHNVKFDKFSPRTRLKWKGRREEERRIRE